MGRRYRRAIRASYRVLLKHLLKWQFQPERRSRSWKNTINRERLSLDETTEQKKEVTRLFAAEIVGAYAKARRQAAGESGLPLKAFPLECPYTFEQIHDFEFLPN